MRYLWLDSIRFREFALLAFILLISPLASTVALAQESFRSLSLEFDRTEGPTARLGTNEASERAQIMAIANESFVCLDPRIKLDGNTEYDVLQSAEDLDRRFNVDCRPGVYGRLPMGDAIEYYIKSRDDAEPRFDLMVYPGSRGKFAYNDVACAWQKGSEAAEFRLRGFFAVLTNEYQEAKVVELRPLMPNRSDAAACKSQNSFRRRDFFIFG